MGRLVGVSVGPGVGEGVGPGVGIGVWASYGFADGLKVSSVGLGRLAEPVGKSVEPVGKGVGRGVNGEFVGVAVKSG